LLVRVDLLWGVGSGTLAGPGCWVVFGTLLGPEATGPWIVSLLWWGVVRGTLFLVFLAGPIMHVCVWGVWFGVVV
jgi:hypothetical protein